MKLKYKNVAMNIHRNIIFNRKKATAKFNVGEKTNINTRKTAKVHNNRISSIQGFCLTLRHSSWESMK